MLDQAWESKLLPQLQAPAFPSNRLPFELQKNYVEYSRCRSEWTRGNEGNIMHCLVESQQALQMKRRTSSSGRGSSTSMSQYGTFAAGHKKFEG